jgi:hypothetical protein
MCKIFQKLTTSTWMWWKIMKICNCWILMSAKVYFSTGFLFPILNTFQSVKKKIWFKQK